MYKPTSVRQCFVRIRFGLSVLHIRVSLFMCEFNCCVLNTVPFNVDCPFVDEKWSDVDVLWWSVVKVK